ncbi:hypothetical protein BOTBODRAFT_35738 [Botryobasidium botryosum FD-172 SS1]|uniref:Major facilitator superfamily (MFS) profile domain-containing protein n=1 Tax=Botryobasidium botryosum (strain FD-172 SS1) TaxID=930990 RepID=A0A067M5Z3_BOTB1|nr:hypothetical protein BOTBODRAFT_35738 [Botryobasidium botryosum FD-172 SS1]
MSHPEIQTDQKSARSESPDAHTKDNTHDLLPSGTVDDAYLAKIHLLNEAIQEIGMGKYQWYLFIVTGFGWFSDNLWPIVTGLILAPVLNEFHQQGPFLKLAQNIGLLIGAFFWGLGSDVWGRRWGFNITLFITGVFGTAAGGSPNFTALSAFAACWSIGVGGNLPVDSAVFLEFIPGSHQYLLTVLSIWWAFGQLIGSLIAWPLIANHSCPQTATVCLRSENMGWRYFLFTMGGIMLLLFFLRFFVFNLYESPKFLVGRGKDAQAIQVLENVAKYNNTQFSLTLEQLTNVQGFKKQSEVVGDGGGTSAVDTSITAVLRRNMQKFDMNHVKALFATRQLAYSTSLVILLWAIIGLAFPLYNAFVTYYLATRGADFGDGSTYITYRNQVILSVIGVPGALVGGWAVDLPYIGRKGSLCISTVLTGVFLFASTTARTSNALLGWNCGYSFTSNIMYGVLYAYTPEIFSSKDRGTGMGLAASANRIFGIMSPIIALYANLTTAVPIWISGALFILAGFIALLLPYEPRGKTSM